MSTNSRKRREAKMLVTFAVALPAILGIAGLVFDAGLMMSQLRSQQHAGDAAATAAAMELLMGGNAASAEAVAAEYVQQTNGLSAAAVTVNVPPQSGPFSGEAGYVEVIAGSDYQTWLMHFFSGQDSHQVVSRSVAGSKPATADAAIMVLDPDPPGVAIAGVPLVLPAAPAIVAGVEVLGLGTVRVDGSVLVNTQWGGVDENGDPAGEAAGPPYAMTATPLLPLTHLTARDIRVAGGVDDPANYGAYEAGGDFPLDAGRLPVPDPLADLPVPTTGVDPGNVSSELRGTVAFPGFPPSLAPLELEPGVYEWIAITGGTVSFQPGVYIVRGTHPITGVALSLIGGAVTADGVMFYITDSADYDPVTGLPDAGDGESVPAAPNETSLTPSVVLADVGSLPILTPTTLRPVDDAGSPYHGMLIFQRRADRRPIVIVHTGDLLSGELAGRIYAKWGHVSMTGRGTYDLAIAAGSIRLVAVIDVEFQPTFPFPPARDVFLVE